MDDAPQPLDVLRHVDRGALEGIAVRCAVTAGRFIVDERPANLTAADTKSSPTDVVTSMDRGAETLIRDMLAAERPDDAVLGEEDGQPGVGASGVTWVVDPIDGTTNYLYGLPAYVVSVAAVVGNPHLPGSWQTVAGAVCAPVSGHVYHARLGGGSWRSVMADGAVLSGETGSAPLRVSSPAGLGQALVATGFGYTGATRARQAAVLAQVLPVVRDIRRFGSAALDLCLVAQGLVDAYYEDWLNPWDVAAGLLIVTEAGGVVSGWTPAEPAAPAVVAGSAAIHAALCEVLDRARAVSM